MNGNSDGLVRKVIKIILDVKLRDDSHFAIFVPEVAPSEYEF